VLPGYIGRLSTGNSGPYRDLTARYKPYAKK